MVDYLNFSDIHSNEVHRQSDVYNAISISTNIYCNANVKRQILVMSVNSYASVIDKKILRRKNWYICPVVLDQDVSTDINKIVM